jgi:hypothetical protein
MLAVALFVAFWVVVAGGLFWVAHRGGLGGSRPRRERTGRRRHPVSNTVLALVYIGFGVALPAVLLIGNHRSSAQVTGCVPAAATVHCNFKLNASEQAGRELFGMHCAVCHTLAAANAVGKVGPNLDTLPTVRGHSGAQLILHTIANGCLQQPLVTGSPQTCLGYGTMPPDIVQGRQAVQVAEFVSSVAGLQ